MSIIKGKEKKLQSAALPSKAKLSKDAKKKLKRRQDAQPVPAVAV